MDRPLFAGFCSAPKTALGCAKILHINIANLLQDAELGTGWGYFEFIHHCRVVGAHKKFQPIFSNPLGRLWYFLSKSLIKVSAALAKLGFVSRLQSHTLCLRQDDFCGFLGCPRNGHLLTAWTGFRHFHKTAVEPDFQNAAGEKTAENESLGPSLSPNEWPPRDLETDLD
jgi:hypothetical protein